MCNTKSKEPGFISVFKDIIDSNRFEIIKIKSNSILGRRDTLILELKKITSPNSQKAYIAKLHDEYNNVDIDMPFCKEIIGSVKRRQYRLNITYLGTDVREMLREMDKVNPNRPFSLFVKKWDYKINEGIAYGNGKGRRNFVISKAQLPEEQKNHKNLVGMTLKALGILKKGENYTAEKIIGLFE